MSCLPAPEEISFALRCVRCTAAYLCRYVDSDIRPAEICRKALIHLSGVSDQSVADRNLECINIAHWHSWSFIYLHNEQPAPTPWNIFIKSYLFYDTTAFIFFVFYFIADAFFFCVTQTNKLSAMLVIKAGRVRGTPLACCPDGSGQLCPPDSTYGSRLKKRTCILSSSLRTKYPSSLARCWC